MTLACLAAGVRSLVWDRENLLAEVGAGGTVAAYTLAPAAYGHLVSQRRSGASNCGGIPSP